MLTLAEDTYSPQNSSGSEDESSAVSREFKRIALKGLVGFVLLIGGWLVVSQLLPGLVRLALQPLASPQVRTVAAPARSLIAPRQNAPVPAVAQPSVNDAPETRQRQLQAFASRDKQKQVAWAAYYSAPASCEHPVNWAAQVECGNMYMRAKKVFEQGWEAEQAQPH